MTPLDQHQLEIQKNLRAWEAKPLLQQIYAGILPADHCAD